LIDIENLAMRFPDGTNALRGVSFRLDEGEILGIVGESGSGKSTLAMCILRLLPTGSEITGKILFEDSDILGMTERQLENLRGGKIAMVFQDAQSAFDPLMRIGRQIIEGPVRKHETTPRDAKLRAISLMGELGVVHPEARYESYPHELSGGLKQRAFTAMAMFEEPKLLIMDEPTSALDVISQSQLVALIKRLRDRGIAVIFITHDIILASTFCDKLLVLYAGRVMEYGETNKAVSDPFHPYTKGLIQSTPSLTRSREGLMPVPGNPPNPRALPSGCKFNPRCAWAMVVCKNEEPDYTKTEDGRIVSCYLNKASYGK
jgi:oligopeptide/dipeptide ABC transporter ATP-binding protein